MKGGGNKKCLGYVAIFIVFQIIVITIFALTVMKVKGPKVRFQTPITVSNINSGSSTSASFSADLVTKFAVKNTNFGHFKYPNSTVSILYEGQVIGSAVVPSQKAKARSTRRTDITISIDSSKLSGTTNLPSAINAGAIPLTSESTLKGKVELIKIIKKNKSGKMSCTMTLNLASKAVDDLKCK
ncbi:late embryogenesis abundant protein At1g64065-like [Argentina anserina]|uniref:late embryogenesis abundant protein At1g64065-like n=1 Tax=Argentina anserina TaxID=57926 RepID=UPI00217633D9|nr:late embryogenesis abundant protein At1g64065-like [Potentilla anserina]